MAPDAVTQRPSGTVTFLFTDIEGSTPLWDAYPEDMRAALTRHDEILGAAIAAHQGHIFSTMGDGLAAVFQTAGAAVGAAVDAQRHLGTEEWPSAVTLKVRMGLHTGEVDERNSDYFGPPVNRAARLMGAANGGQIVMSALTAGLLDGVSEVSAIDLGLVLVKGIADPLQIYGVAAEQHEWLDVPLISNQRSAGNLPRPTTEYVGDLADLQRRVARLTEARLVTLTGSGGVGKTRAAIEVGWLTLDEYVDGAWFVELGPLADPDAVAGAVAAALHITPQAEVSLEDSIVDWCIGRRMLLVIDNCEHLLAPLVGLVTKITTSCPTATVLATSREPLGVQGEIVIRIPSLRTDHGRELFVQRALASEASFDPNADDLAVIDAICERLDGIPLAIELAASRSRSLSPLELLERLTDRFRLLRSGGRSGLERHQTLRATVQWSYQLLEEPERALFDRLSVFAGTFDLDAAERVCEGDGIDEFDIADLLGELVDKSMVISSRAGVTTRFRLLETLRQYGEEQLEERGGTRALREAHADHYLEVAHRLHHRWLGPAQVEADIDFGVEWDNLRAAHLWMILDHRVENATQLCGAVSVHGWSRVRSEVGEWARRTRDAMSGPIPATILNEIAYWDYLDGSWEAAIAAATEGLDDAEDPGGAIRCRANLVFALQSAGRSTDVADHAGPLQLASQDRSLDPDARWRAAWTHFQIAATTSGAGPAIEELADITRELDVPTYNAELQRMLGLAKLGRPDNPDPVGAIEDLSKALGMIEEVSLRGAWAHANLAIAVVLGQQPNAAAVLRRSVAATHDGRNWAAVAMTLELAAHLLATAGNVAAAETVMGPLLLVEPGWGAAGHQFRAATMDAIGEQPDSEAHRERGRTMDRHEMVAFTLARLDELIAASGDEGSVGPA